MPTSVLVHLRLERRHRFRTGGPPLGPLDDSDTGMVVEPKQRCRLTPQLMPRLTTILSGRNTVGVKPSTLLTLRQISRRPEICGMLAMSLHSTLTPGRQPTERNHPFFEDTSIEGLQRRRVLFLA